MYSPRVSWHKFYCLSFHQKPVIQIVLPFFVVNLVQSFCFFLHSCQIISLLFFLGTVGCKSGSCLRCLAQYVHYVAKFRSFLFVWHSMLPGLAHACLCGTACCQVYLEYASFLTKECLSPCLQKFRRVAADISETGQ